MSPYVLPVLYTLFLWWFSTGLILFLDGLPRRSYRWSMLGATLLLIWALYGLARTASDASVAGAYLAFTYGVLAWGWQEIAFLMGFVTGPRRTACPPGCRGWRRARYAIETIAYHELALVATGLAVLALTWGAVNQVGAWTFLILWTMRLSAKLNLFLGVRNLNEQFLPPHLRYLQSYFVRKAMNPLFPVSVVLSSVVAAFVWRAAAAPEAGMFEATACTFLATLLTLAILEHWLMMLPLPTTALWSWGMRSRTHETADIAAQASLSPLHVSNEN